MIITNPAKPVFKKARKRGAGIPEPIARQASNLAFSIDTLTGAVHTHFSENAGTPVYPASMAKLSVYMAVMDHIRGGKINPDQIIKISNRAKKLTGRYSGVDALPVTDCLDALLVHSANDVATALAEHIAGTEWRFCHEILNPKCRNIGMTQTEFWSASGLSNPNMPLTKDSPESVTTASDLQKLLIHLVRNYPEIFDITSKETITIGENIFKNTNPFIGVDGFNGMKTGTLEVSGHHLIVSRKTENDVNFSITLGNKTKEEMKENALRFLSLNPRLEDAHPIQNKPD